VRGVTGCDETLVRVRRLTSMRSCARLFALSIPLIAACSGTSSAGGPNTGSLDPTPPNDSYTYDVSFFALANGDSERIVQANFAVTTGGTQCTSELVAGCTVSTCAASSTPSTSKPVDPGALTVSNASFGQSVPIPLTAGLGRVVQSGTWNGGETVELKGTGGADIPAFDVTATIPAALTNMEIDGCSSTNQPCALSAGGSLATWSGGDGTTVTLTLSPSVDTPTKVSAVCRWPGGNYAGRIPGDVIGRLPKGTAYGPSFATQIEANVIEQGATYRAAIGAQRIFMGTTIKLTTPS
jgi:hypothetical protein